MAKFIKKVRSIGPITQSTKREGDIRNYDALSNLDKRVSKRIEAAITAAKVEFGELAASKLNETFFLGYYIDGGYVGVLGNELKFTSPIDDYVYSQNQVVYIWSIFSTRTANLTNDDGTPFVQGQLKIPALPVSNSGPGEILYVNFIVRQDDGSVTCQVTYRLEATGVATDTNDGVLAIFALCSRATTP